MLPEQYVTLDFLPFFLYNLPIPLLLPYFLQQKYTLSLYSPKYLYSLEYSLFGYSKNRISANQDFLKKDSPNPLLTIRLCNQYIFLQLYHLLYSKQNKLLMAPLHYLPHFIIYICPFIIFCKEITFITFYQISFIYNCT